MTPMGKPHAIPNRDACLATLATLGLVLPASRFLPLQRSFVVFSTEFSRYVAPTPLWVGDLGLRVFQQAANQIPEPSALLLLELSLGLSLARRTPQPSRAT